MNSRNRKRAFNIHKELPPLFVLTSKDGLSDSIQTIKSATSSESSPGRKRLSFNFEEVYSELQDAFKLDSPKRHSLDISDLGDEELYFSSPERVTVSPYSNDPDDIESPKNSIPVSLKLESESMLTLNESIIEMPALGSITPPPLKKWKWIKKIANTIKDIPEISVNILRKESKEQIKHPPAPFRLGESELIRNFEKSDMTERQINGRQGYGFPDYIEKYIYRLSHLKLNQPKRPLIQQVMLSNLMLSILGAHADLNLGIQPTSFINGSIKKQKPKKLGRIVRSPSIQTPKPSTFRRPGRKSAGVLNYDTEVELTQKDTLVDDSAVNLPRIIPESPLLRFDSPTTHNDPDIDLLNTSPSFPGPMFKNSKRNKSMDGLGQTRKEKKDRRKSLNLHTGKITPGKKQTASAGMRYTLNEEDDEDDIPLANLNRSLKL